MADPSHVKEEKERFLKFYRGRNAPKKGSGQTGSNGASNTPTKNVKEVSRWKWMIIYLILRQSLKSQMIT